MVDKKRVRHQLVFVVGAFGFLLSVFFSMRLIPNLDAALDIDYSPVVFDVGEIQHPIQWSQLESIRLQGAPETFQKPNPIATESKEPQREWPSRIFRMTGVLINSAEPGKAKVQLTSNSHKMYWLNVHESLPGPFSNWKVKKISAKETVVICQRQTDTIQTSRVQDR